MCSVVPGLVCTSPDRPAGFFPLSFPLSLLLFFFLLIENTIFFFFFARYKILCLWISFSCTISSLFAEQQIFVCLSFVANIIFRTCFELSPSSSFFPFSRVNFTLTLALSILQHGCAKVPAGGGARD